jgi:hypothetical protein
MPIVMVALIQMNSINGLLMQVLVAVAVLVMELVLAVHQAMNHRHSAVPDMEPVLVQLAVAMVLVLV